MKVLLALFRAPGSAFIGSGSDWSAIGWMPDAQSGRATSFSLITPLHTLSSSHNPITVLGTEARLVNMDGDVAKIGLRGTSNTPTDGGDLNVAPLNRAVSSSEGITPLRILDISSAKSISLILQGAASSPASGIGPYLARTG